MAEVQPAHLPTYPRVTIEYCTQCKWMLRAAYYAQELLSTFEASVAEVSLRPAPSGTFRVSVTTLPTPHPADTDADAPTATTKLLWDRRTDGGFPETKELKKRVRDVIQPGRDLGHVDRVGGKPTSTSTTAPAPAPGSTSAAATATAEKAGHPATCEVGSLCKDCE
ncbi:related to selenoprotein domain protein [Cephalotrichum gorgonifer]|uniref:Related to selenoprotein domain protein n=1 Tax=Cephalotrichum gorgonifer TaxID=2041049 RepID=A0AAE8MUX4_9PEZI|nr:related to selenoprotein domain protein [Cephalotrichum gorgonifer]